MSCLRQTFYIPKHVHAKKISLVEVPEIISDTRCESIAGKILFYLFDNLTKLIKIGNEPTKGNALLSILKDNVISIMNGNLISQELTSNFGVQQGDKLSPLIFLLYIADLSRLLESSGSRIYFSADDLAIGSTVFDIIQTSMDIIEAYSCSNFLIVNIAEAMILKSRHGRGALAAEDKLLYQNQFVDFVTQFLLSYFHAHTKFLSIPTSSIYEDESAQYRQLQKCRNRCIYFRFLL